MCIQVETLRKTKFFTRNRTAEEDADEREADSAKDEANKVRPMKTTLNCSRKTEAIAEPSKEGGASIPAQADKTQPDAHIVENWATTKKSVERRSMNRPKYKPTNHELRAQLRLRRPYRNVHDET